MKSAEDALNKVLIRDLDVHLSNPILLLNLLIAFFRQRNDGKTDLFAFATQWVDKNAPSDKRREGDVLRNRAVALYNLFDRLPRHLAWKDKNTGNDMVHTSLVESAALTPLQSDNNALPAFDVETLVSNAHKIAWFKDIKYSN